MKSMGELPQVRLSFDGAPLDAAAAASVAAVRVQQRLSLPAICDVTFVQRARPLEHLPRIGARLALRVDDDALLFEGDVTAIEYSSRPATGRTAHIRAYDDLHRLRARQPVKAHTDFTPASLAREVAADAGLTVEAAAEGQTIARSVQHRQHDLAFLTEICARAGLEMVVIGGVLHLLRLEESADVVELELDDTLVEARIELNASPLCRTVAARGWDPQDRGLHNGSVDAGDVDGALTDSLSTAPVRTLSDELLLDDAHAEEIAGAELARRNHGAVSVWGIAAGDVRLRPGATVSLAGVAPEAKTAVITSVDHTIARTTGFRSEFTNELPAPRVRERAAIASPGIVARVDDPEGMGRVKLTLPTYADVETEWLPIVTAGGGAAKGLIAVPDVDDLVLAIFPRGEPGLGFVLGGIYRDAHPDAGIDDGRVKRFSFLTAGGQKLQFDDTHGSIRIENKQGSYVELAPDKLVVHAATDLDIEAPGRAVTIRGNTIDFERA
jgi:phage baseplate assembly protein gpV/phage protein D